MLLFREDLSFVHHAEVAALDVKEANRLLDWAQATIATTGKPRSTKDLRREVWQAELGCEWLALRLPREGKDSVGGTRRKELNP